MHRPACLALWFLSACESQRTVAEEMERGLGESNDAVLAALLSGELLVHVDGPVAPTTPVRHDPSACGCPCLSRVGDNVPYVQTLDYATLGCIPTTGMLPTALSGHVVLVVEDDGECDASWQDFTFALEHEVSGTFSGRSVAEGVGWRMAALGALEVGPRTFDLDLDLVTDAGGVHVDGTVSVGPAPAGDPRQVVLRDVFVPFDAIGAPCPRPSAGTATLTDGDEAQDVSVVFDRPGDGFVVVQRKGRESEPADFCAYASELW
ncbi:MAG: hypothetical protein ABMA64_08675 [Myxococcota bacterium]